MGKEIPLVSIGLPVYNGECYLRQAIDSLLAQDYPALELLISDNASTDGTAQICQEYAAREERIRYYRSAENRGAAWNFTNVLTLASGEYFMWAAHDDYHAPGYLSTCLEAFQASGKLVLTGTMCDLVNAETGALIYTDRGFSTIGLSPGARFRRYKREIHAGRHIGGIFYGLYRRRELQKVMPLKQVVGADHLVLAGLCWQGEFVTVPERLLVKRWGGASVSHRENARALKISNPFFISFPYFVREIFLQKMIWNTDRLSASGKIRLMVWSLGNYLALALRLRCRQIFVLAARFAVAIRNRLRPKKRES